MNAERSVNVRKQDHRDCMGLIKEDIRPKSALPIRICSCPDYALIFCVRIAYIFNITNYLSIQVSFTYIYLSIYSVIRSYLYDISS